MTPKKLKSPKGWRVTAATGTGNGYWYCRIYNSHGLQVACPDIRTSCPIEARNECVRMAHAMADYVKTKQL